MHNLLSCEIFHPRLHENVTVLCEEKSMNKNEWQSASIRNRFRRYSAENIDTEDDKFNFNKGPKTKLNGE